MVEIIKTEQDLMQLTSDILLDVNTDIMQKNTISIPIAQFATLGTSVSALIPAFRNVAQTTSLDTTGLYRLANSGVEDVLKQAKDGTYWGSLKTPKGKSKMAKFQKVDSVSATSNATLPINPATIMMGVALASIEKQLDNIVDMQKQILSFLETEKQSEIEADVEILTKIISNYKFNWDNKHFVANNHKLALDIKRTSKKHMISYQKKVDEILNSKQFIVFQAGVNSTLEDLIKSFKYYRLSLYTFSMSSLAEILLSGNFNEEYISTVKEEIEISSMTYRELHTQCSISLEKMSGSSFETNALKIMGVTTKAVGKLFSNVPLVKKSTSDDFLQNKGSRLEDTANELKNNIIKSFAEINNPNTMIFIEKMKDIIQIYNHTEEIYFDENRIYLIAN